MNYHEVFAAAHAAAPIVETGFFISVDELPQIAIVMLPDEADIQEFCARTGIPSLTGSLEHENQHRTAIRELGSVATLGVAFHREVVRKRPFRAGLRGRLVTHHPQLEPHMTAAVAAYPVQPSQGDIMCVKRQGFPTLKAWAEFVIEYNSSVQHYDLPTLPEPMWLRG